MQTHRNYTLHTQIHTNCTHYVYTYYIHHTKYTNAHKLHTTLYAHIHLFIPYNAFAHAHTHTGHHVTMHAE